MKPKLIFVNESDGKVIMTKEELERLLDETYEQGKADGGITSPWTINPNPYYGGTIPCGGEQDE
jgi:hypothetical protein